MARAPLTDFATFDDRYTMRFVRELPHPIERVWETVTQAEQLNLWLMPVTEIEPRLGGVCRFSWGAPGETANDGEVLVFDPPHRVRYGQEHGAIEFQLEATEDGTRLTFLQLFTVGLHGDPMSDRPGGGLPAGPDTPWRPGFVAGFHIALDDIAPFLARTLSSEQIALESARAVKLANTPDSRHHFEEADESGPWHHLVEVYEKIIREQCPPR